MKGVIVNFRRGRHVQTTNQMIIKADGVSKREDASKLVGKQVVWKSPAKKELKGSVRSAHGNNGAVRVLFETGMPGQSIGEEVEIKG